MSTKKIIIYGAGGHGKMVADAAIAQGEFEVVGFLDDVTDAQQVIDLPVFREIPEGVEGGIVGVGDPKNREMMTQKLQDAGLTIVTVVHPTATICKGAELGDGTVVMPQAVVGADAKLGVGSIVNTDATVDHDCKIGDFAHISPGAHLAGNVHVGSHTQVGIGASAKEEVSIGENTIIGAGATVVSDIEDNCVAIGTPAKKTSDNA